MPETSDQFFWRGGTEEDRDELRAFAMAAATLGCRLRPVPFADITSSTSAGLSRRLTWFFEESPSAAEIAQKWDSQEWRDANPDDPITILWQFWENLKAARAQEPAYAQQQFSRGNRSVLVPTSWPVEKKRAAIARLNS